MIAEYSLMISASVKLITVALPAIFRCNGQLYDSSPRFLLKPLHPLEFSEFLRFSENSRG